MSDRWDRVVDVFTGAHYGSARGEVRRALLDRHVRDHAPDGPLRVLDVGAGGGNVSIPWAQRGHAVTLVDFSPDMLAEAGRRATAAGVADRVEVIEGDLMDLDTLIPAGSFDVVMLHGVIMYLDQPEEAIARLATAAAPGGVISVLAKHRDTLAMRYGMERDWKTALTAFDASTEVNRLGFETRADTVGDVERWFEASGLAPLAWYGVRLFTEHWGADEQADPEDWDALLEAEYQASRRDPYRSLARLIHVLGRKV